MKFAILPLLALAAKGCTLDLSQANLLKNSQFDQNKCEEPWCLYSKDNYHNEVQAWLPDPELEIGHGSVYSGYLTNERVLELDGNANTCVKQVIPSVHSGDYQITLDYLAR